MPSGLVPQTRFPSRLQTEGAASESCPADQRWSVALQAWVVRCRGLWRLALQKVANNEAERKLRRTVKVMKRRRLGPSSNGRPVSGSIFASCCAIGDVAESESHIRLVDGLAGDELKCTRRGHGSARGRSRADARILGKEGLAEAERNERAYHEVAGKKRNGRFREFTPTHCLE